MSALIIREYLIDLLEPIFGKLKTADGMAAELAKHLPQHADAEALVELANRIIASRKSKGFPSASELISAVKSLPASGGNQPRRSSLKFETNAEKQERERQAEEAERRAIRLLAGTDLARRAIEERWGPGLIEFTAKNGRAPGGDEERPIIALSHRIDADTEALRNEANGQFAAVARGYWQLRRDMYDKAARVLGFADVKPAPAVTGKVRLSHEVKITPIDPATLAPTDELLDAMGFAR